MNYDVDGNDDDDDDDDEDSDYDDGYDDFADGQSTIKTTGYKSVAFLNQKKNGKMMKHNSPNSSFSNGTTMITLPYIVDVWLGKNAQKHVSIQVQLLAGNTNNIETRVTTDQKFLSITFPMTKYLSSPSHAFVPYVLAQDQHKKDEQSIEHCKVALSVHPKTYARQKSVAVIKNRDASKVVMYEQRIPLPFPCMFDYCTTAHDNYFYGERKVHYQDSSVHLQIELVADVGDRYVAEAESLMGSLHVTDYYVPKDTKIPGNISVTPSGKNRRHMDLDSIDSKFFMNVDNETLKTTKSAAASRRSCPVNKGEKRLALTDIHCSDE
jgi:hypothetical protein